MTTALIVDDESPARNLMADLLRAHPRVEVIGMAASVAEAVRFVRTRPPDLIFLDVDMPGGHGFDLIPALEKKTHLVFVTAHERFALDAFGVGATDYLVKPVAPARLAVTLERVAQFPPQAGEAPDLAAAPGPATPTTASIPLGGVTGRLDVIAPTKILWIEAEQNYSRLHLDQESKRILGNKTLSAWEESLAGNGFERITRSILIQTGKIKHLTWKGRDETFVRFHGSEKVLALGRAGAIRLKALLNC
jgi:two-component system LytT family response regulator